MRALALLVFASAVLAGCYNPGIGEGAFICGSGGLCPAGWKCGPDNRCYRTTTNFDGNPSDAPATPETRPDTGPATPDAPGVCQRGLTCSPGAATGPVCDLVCQTGCGCNDRCTLLLDQAICRPITAQPTALYESCQVDERDTCAAGAICAPESDFLKCGAHCARACRVDADCGNESRCTESLANRMGRFVTKICGPRIQMCNPVGANAPCPDLAKRPSPQFGCYLLDPGRNEATVCDCAGKGALNDACMNNHECVPGLECLPAGPSGELRCRQLCNMGSGSSGCTTGTCRALAGSTRVGVCL